MADPAGEHAIKEHTMTKAELVEEVTRVTELPRKESEAVVETIFESIIAALQSDDKIEIRGFGSFRTRQRRGRTGTRPAELAEWIICGRRGGTVTSPTRRKMKAASSALLSL
jgi:nucleoid DNA-binding protein